MFPARSHGLDRLARASWALVCVDVSGWTVQNLALRSSKATR